MRVGSQRGRSQQAAAKPAKHGQAQLQPEQLHPSWQAKKQQQAALVLQPTGKKVVFDD